MAWWNARFGVVRNGSTESVKGWQSDKLYREREQEAEVEIVSNMQTVCRQRDGRLGPYSSCRLSGVVWSETGEEQLHRARSFFVLGPRLPVTVASGFMKPAPLLLLLLPP